MVIFDYAKERSSSLAMVLVTIMLSNAVAGLVKYMVDKQREGIT